MAAEAQGVGEARIIDSLLPPPTTLSEATVTQLRWNALAREEAIREFGVLTAAQLARIRGSSTSNPHVTTGRWLAAGAVFAVQTPEGRLFPAFQFDVGRPRPIIARVLGALDGSLRVWGILLSFTGSNGYLDGEQPVDQLGSDPDAVVFAAEQVGEDTYG